MRFSVGWDGMRRECEHMQVWHYLQMDPSLLQGLPTVVSEFGQ